MRLLETLPPAFRRFEKMHGVLSFAVFEEAEGSEEEALSAMASAFAFDPDRLRLLGSRRIRERRFFGDWYDSDNGKLVERGSFTLADGSVLENPTLERLARVQYTSSASPLPDVGSGGQFAFAFLRPPYGLRGRAKEVQAVFEEIRDFILPPGQTSEISDWSSPRLPEVSDYFIPGMLWWGAFLFSLHIPAMKRLTLIAGSASD